MCLHTSRFANVCSQIKLNFHPLEVVGRGSETQLQVGEKFNSITCRFDPFSAGIHFRRQNVMSVDVESRSRH